MSRLVVGPFNRVEGDLEVTLDTADGRVREARVTAPLYRGFENLLVGRPLLDALVIVPRICGICSVSQSAAAVAAMRSLAGPAAEPMPKNGRLASNLILSSEVLLDHLTHFYLFFMPDFARADYAGAPWYADTAARFAAQKGAACAEFLPVRARYLTVLGILAGKWPHTLALRPGGVTRAVSSGERMRLLALVHEMRQFLEARFFGDTLEHVLALADGDALTQWATGRAADWPRFLQLAQALHLSPLGLADSLLLAAGAYPAADDAAAVLFPGGVIARKLDVKESAGTREHGATVAAFDAGQIAEDTHAAWYADAHAAPAAGETRPQADKAGAYSWCKAPRYGGQVAETGAWARQCVAGQPLIRALHAAEGGNVMSRVVARGIEVARLLLAMESWVRALDDRAPFHVDMELPQDGEGVGLIEAARGTLGHWVRIEGGKIASYQIIAPTTWNFSPRDARGVPGALEQALVGLPLRDDGKASVLVQHVVRSFDPCLACTVH